MPSFFGCSKWGYFCYTKKIEAFFSCSNYHQRQEKQSKMATQKKQQFLNIVDDLYNKRAVEVDSKLTAYLVAKAKEMLKRNGRKYVVAKRSYGYKSAPLAVIIEEGIQDYSDEDYSDEEC
ncbi:hypothetical protein EBZ80_22190 [bacterium]|nr:hypothetical protein [bacterium]